MSENLSRNKKVILFDGICNLCNSSVQFIITHDRKKSFLFASLQSDVATKIMFQLNQNENENFDSIVLIENEMVYFKSDAALRIAKELNGIIKLCYIFIIIPRPLRDVIYDYIAKNRYKWYGKKESCRLPSPAEADRFL